MSLNMLISLSRFKKEQKLSKKGFTLPELLIAAVIFAFVVTGILLMFINCAFLDQANRNRSIATIHAELIMENIMEYMKTNTLGSLEAGIDNGLWYWDDLSAVTICSKLGCASCAYPCVLDNESISTTYGTTGADPLDITVLVSWQDRGKVRNLELQTLISIR